MTKTISLEIKDSIASIIFNRPEAMNSFNGEMAEELEMITHQVQIDKAVRAVLLKGAGALFMAGGDLRYFKDNLASMEKVVMITARRLNACIQNLMYMPKPVLAAVHGSVAGVGMSLMMACDLVIAAENTKFTMAYSGIGASADGGASFNLPRHVGLKKAMEIILLSEVFDAKTAQSIGLINWVVPDDQLTQQAEKILNRLVQGPTQAYAQIKKLINQYTENDLAKHLELEGESFAKCAVTEDFKEGITSFLQKKKANFKGV